MSLFFVHIPKTAGTSFRQGAEKYFSSERIVYDYGANSKVTSPLAKEFLHADQPDFWQFRQALDNPAMISGHVPITRFVSLWGREIRLPSCVNHCSVLPLNMRILSGIWITKGASRNSIQIRRCVIVSVGLSMA